MDLKDLPKESQCYDCKHQRNCISATMYQDEGFYFNSCQRYETSGEHQLFIGSLHDAQAHCKCGWRYAVSGSRTKDEIMVEYLKHIGEYYEQK